ncbi:membrane protein [Formosimonas limnophila]|uniref:Membrane protein n=1 Tax=Formosimonas limnophila TaxID=1384487 RepID=A0A8J3FXL9_9BURK|nr:CPCC family cysteine-rich protein [Formosimonas limnophila]GHA65671.1 membrane protein [Formosimonas limnophila]
MKQKFPCPCCGYLVWDYPDGTFEICDICLWQDDPIQKNEPNYSGGANDVSLNKAKENFKKYGVCEERFIGAGRRPYQNELPTSNQNE